MKQLAIILVLIVTTATVPVGAEFAPNGAVAQPSGNDLQQQTRLNPSDGASVLALADAQRDWARDWAIEFVRKAAEGGLAEMKMGELAQRKSSNQAVRQFGRQMVKAYVLASEKLRIAAGELGVTVPDQMSGKQRVNYNKLRKLSGVEFDRAYIRAQIEEHKQTVRLYMNEARRDGPARVREFAMKTLLTLERHLTDAEQISQKLQ